jgi:hypothetical protein
LYHKIVLNPRETIIPAHGVRSLVWAGDELVDFAGGGTRYARNGSISEGRVRWAFPFDAAATARDFAVIYCRLGTKALLLKNGTLLRELNRSFYFADTYEYPVCLVERGGDVLLIHCPEDYNRLEIEDAATGARLTSRQSTASDFFHSRLSVNETGTRLLSAGWLWHPWDAVVYFDLDEALRNPQHLDSLDWSAPTPSHVGTVQESSACWLTDSQVVLAGGDDDEQSNDDSVERTRRLLANGLAVYDTSRRAVVSGAALGTPAGTMMPVGETHVITFYEHPRLVRLADGALEYEWHWLSSGAQTGSIMNDTPPPMALDPRNRRFAIAQADGVHIIECSRA